MFDKDIMAIQDAPLAKYAEVFVTLNGRRYNMLSCIDFEAKVKINTKDVPRMGATVTGKKAVGAEIPFKMKVYKCSEMFDDVVEQFIKTGKMPLFDIQTSNEDPSTSIGRSTRVLNDCTLDGDVLLSLVGSGDNYIEQEISGYASGFTRPEKYRAPSYM